MLPQACLPAVVSLSPIAASRCRSRLQRRLSFPSARSARSVSAQAPCRQGIAAVVGNRVVELLETVKVDEPQAKLGRGRDWQRVGRDLRGQPVRPLG